MKLNKRDLLLELASQLILEAISNEDLYNKYYKNKGISEDEFNTLINTGLGTRPDGTAGPLTKIMLNWFVKGLFDLTQLKSVVDNLTIFEKNKIHSPIQSLEQLTDFNYFMKVMSRFTGDDETHFLSQKDNKERLKGETEFLYEDSEWLVLTPKTKAASIFWGKGTRWCTAATSAVENAFDQYNSNGPLIILVNKERKDSEGRQVKYQFQYCSESFMDANDKRIKRPVLQTIGANDQLRDFIIGTLPEDVSSDDIKDILTSEKRVENDAKKPVMVNTTKGELINLVNYRRIDRNTIRRTNIEYYTADGTPRFIYIYGSDTLDDVVIDIEGTAITFDTFNKGFMGEYDWGYTLHIDGSFLNISNRLNSLDAEIIVTSLLERYEGYVVKINGEYKNLGVLTYYSVPTHDGFILKPNDGDYNEMQYYNDGRLVFRDEHRETLNEYNGVVKIGTSETEALLSMSDGTTKIVRIRHGLETAEVKGDYSEPKILSGTIIGQDSFLSGNPKEEFTIKNGRFFESVLKGFFILTNGSEVSPSSGGLTNFSGKILKIIPGPNSILVLTENSVYWFSEIFNKYQIGNKINMNLLQNAIYTEDKNVKTYVYNVNGVFLCFVMTKNELKTFFSFEIPNFSRLMPSKNSIKIIDKSTTRTKIIVTTDNDVYEEVAVNKKLSDDFYRSIYENVKNFAESINSDVDYGDEDGDEDDY